MEQLDRWFKPWEYAHYSWSNDIEDGRMFNQLNDEELAAAYPLWCEQIGIASQYAHYQNQWIEKYWLEEEHLLLAVNLLGCLMHKQKDELINASLLKWAQQTSLARPIILTRRITFKNNFEAGINLLYQVIQCYCGSIWTRFLLKLPKELIQDMHIYTEPLLSVKMILINEKMWHMVIKKLKPKDAMSEIENLSYVR
jgi:hypothetical protein